MCIINILLYFLGAFDVLVAAIDSSPNPTLALNNYTTNPFREPFVPVHCLQVSGQVLEPLDPSTCGMAAGAICYTLNLLGPTQIRRSTWLWQLRSGCAMGFYFSPDAPVPDFSSCRILLGALVEKCTEDLRFNGGGINVRIPPRGSSNGSAFVEGEARYLMAPRKLTS